MIARHALIPLAIATLFGCHSSQPQESVPGPRSAGGPLVSAAVPASAGRRSSSLTEAMTQAG